VPPCRAFAKGDFDGLSPLPHAHTPDFVPSCPLLNARVAALHARLPFDPFAQIKIDAHLLAAALRDDSPRLVMLPEDAPQLATLPDIGHLIRSCLVARRWTASYLHSLLHACIPCPRPSIAALPPDSASAPLLLNILLATLLGLYPQSVKQPPFPVRVALFRRVHAAITLDGPSQMALLTRIQPLLVLALTEYLCHILPRHMPSEYDALRAAFPVDPFFATAAPVFDLFRQDHIDSGAEPWDTLARAAQDLHERLTRTYRSKCRLPPPPRRAPLADLPADPAAFCVAALDAHPLVRYPCTDDIAVRRAEYAILLNSAALAEAAVVHSLVTVAPLPANITRLQEAALDALSQRCQRRARVRRTHYLCLLCERRGRKASPRLCSRTFRIVCRTCNDSPDSIVPIDTVGRIVTIRSRQLIFAPCCATVRDYTASGHDFAPGPCRHSLAPRTDRPLKPPRVRVACAMCDAPALPRGHDYLDHLPCRMTVCFLCQRHTPPDDWLRHVPNRRCFDAVCLEWDRKLRALHRRG
jgi:hypothetical protein